MDIPNGLHFIHLQGPDGRAIFFSVEFQAVIVGWRRQLMDDIAIAFVDEYFCDCLVEEDLYFVCAGPEIRGGEVKNCVALVA